MRDQWRSLEATREGVKAVITADWAGAVTERSRPCDVMRCEVMNHCDAVVTAFARTHVNVLLLVRRH